MKNKSAQGNDKKDINDMAIEYMEQKYGETFEYVAPWGNSMSGNHEIIVRCDSLNGQDVLVEVEKYKSDERVFRDNYLAVKYEGETVAFLKKCADEVFSESKVFYKAPYMTSSPGLAADAGFEEFFSDSGCFIAAFIVVKASTFQKEEQAMRVLNNIVTVSGDGRMTISLVLLDDDAYAIVNEKTISDVILSKQFQYCIDLLQENGNTSFIPRED